MNRDGSAAWTPAAKRAEPMSWMRAPRRGRSAPRYWNRNLASYFSAGDRVLEAVGIEAVETAVGCICLRIHQEADRATLGRVGQRHVVRGVVGEPVAFPAAEELRTHGGHEGMIHLDELARLHARDLGHVGG